MSKKAKERTTHWPAGWFAPKARATSASRATTIWATVTFRQRRAAVGAPQRPATRPCSRSSRPSCSRPWHGLANRRMACRMPSPSIRASRSVPHGRCWLPLVLATAESDVNVSFFASARRTMLPAGSLGRALPVGRDRHRHCGDVDDQSRALASLHRGDPRHRETSGPQPRRPDVRAAPTVVRIGSSSGLVGVGSQAAGVGGGAHDVSASESGVDARDGARLWAGDGVRRVRGEVAAHARCVEVVRAPVHPQLEPQRWGERAGRDGQQPRRRQCGRQGVQQRLPVSRVHVLDQAALPGWHLRLPQLLARGRLGRPDCAPFRGSPAQHGVDRERQLVLRAWPAG